MLNMSHDNDNDNDDVNYYLYYHYHKSNSAVTICNIDFLQLLRNSY